MLVNESPAAVSDSFAAGTCTCQFRAFAGGILTIWFERTSSNTRSIRYAVFPSNRWGAFDGC
jgi:hypothetical protein